MDQAPRWPQDCMLLYVHRYQQMTWILHTNLSQETCSERNVKVDFEKVHSSFPSIVFSSFFFHSNFVDRMDIPQFWDWIRIFIMNIEQCCRGNHKWPSNFRTENRNKIQVVISRVREKEAPYLGQKSGKRSHPFLNRDVSLHSSRPPVRTYATVTAVLEVMFRTLYDVVEFWENRDLAPHFAGNLMPESPPLPARRDCTRVHDGWRLIIAISK